MEDHIQWKTTYKYEKFNISATTGRILLKFETEAIRIKSECTKVSNEDDLKRKTTLKYESGIYQQPLVGSYSNFKLKLLG